MKITKFKRALSVLLVAVMVISTMPLNTISIDEFAPRASANDSNSLSDWFSDLIWEIFIKPSLKPSATVKGLPENANVGFDTVIKQYNSLVNGKNGSPFGTIVDMFDIKAVDKTTGEEIHPTGEFEITVKDVAIKPGHNAAIWHILDNEEVIRNADNVIEITDAAFVSAFSDAAAAAEKATGKSGVICVELIDDIERSGQNLTFKTDSFSIYVVSENPTLNIRFYNGNTLINTISVRYADKDILDSLIYDQPIDTSNTEGIMFRGWTNDPNYVDPDTALTIKEVRTAVQKYLIDSEGDFEDGTNLDFYAMLYKQFVVSYFDERGVVCLGRDTFLYRADRADGAIGADGTIDYRINMSYLPSNSGQAFLGWTINEGREGEFASYSDNLVSIKPEGSNDYTSDIPSIIDNPIPAKIKGDVYLKAVAPVGNWLVFEENGKGGKYNAPQFVEAGTNTQKPCEDSEMTRLGYTFGGWYTDAACTDGNEFTFGKTFTDPEYADIIDDSGKIIVYAKWIPKETAPYTVILWTQNVGRTGYDVQDSYVNNNGTVGQNIPYTFVDNGDEDYVTGVGNGNGHYTGFCLTEASKDQQVEITPEGDAVLNLYYDRIEYNFKFYLYRDGTQNNRYDYANNSGNGRDLNDLVTWHSNQNAHPSVTGYTIQSERVGGRTYYYFVMQAYYGEDISSKWPKYDQITGANGREAVSFVMMVGTKLKPNPTNQGSGTVKGIITVMNENILGATNDSDGNYIVIRFPGSYYNWRYHIWFETVEGEDYTGKTLHTQTVNGETRTYYEETVLVVRSSNTTDDNQNEPKYPGFDYVTRLGWNNNQTTWQGGHWTTRENGATLYHLNYVYNRQLFKISYFDGNYVDGNGNTLENRAAILLHESPEIGYKVTIADAYKNYVPDIPEGYVFEGWYVDEGCTTPVIWDTMPEGGITVHAKWRQIQYRVFLRPDTVVGEDDDGEPIYAKDVIAPDPESGLWGKSNQALNFRISYGDKVSLPTGVDTNHIYEFGGWYLDPEYKHPFSGNEKLNDSLEGYFEEYTKTGADNMTDVMDTWGHGATTNSDITGNNGGDRFWITEKLELYALWRRVLDGADGVKVIYDYATGEVDDETPSTYSSTSTIAFSDNHIYQDRAITYGAAVPQPVTIGEGENAKTYYFRYWVRQEWVKSESSYSPAVTVGNEPTGISDSRKIYPGESFRVDSQYARRIDHGETSEYFIHYVAVYTEAEAPKTTVKYDKNGGDWAVNNNAPKINGVNVTSNGTVITYQNSENQTVNLTYTEKDNGQYGFEIEINKSFDILSNANETYVSREGYKFLGWATQDAKDLTPEQFKQALAATAETDPQYAHRRHVFKGDGSDPLVAADTLDDPNNRANTLYAMWEVAMIPVTVKKALPETGDKQRAEDDEFTINLRLGGLIQSRGIEKLSGENLVPYTGTTATMTATLTLAADGTATVYVPYGSTLTVNETITNTAKYEQTSIPYTTENVHNTDITGSDGTYTITGTDGVNAGTITVNNRVKDYVVTVKKTVPADVTFPEGTKFPFTCSTNLIEGGQFELGPNETKTFENRIKYGDKVSVSETANANVYTATSVLVNSAEYTQGAEHTVINDTNFEFTNNIVSHPVTVTKNVESIDPADTDGTNKFTINVVNATGTTTETLTLANGQSNTDINKAFSLAYGTRFKVEENPGDNYDVEITVTGATKDGEYYIVEGPVNITVKNIRKTVDVTITKTVENEKAAEDFKDTEFEFTVTAPGVTADTDKAFKLKHGGEKTVTVPMGAEVTITETPVDKFTASYSLNGGEAVSGSTVTFTASGENVTVTETSATAQVDFVNVRDDVEVEIRKFVDLDRDTGKVFKFNVFVDDVLKYENVEVTSVLQNTQNATGVKKTVPYGSTVRVEEVTGEEYNGEGHTVAEIFTTTLPAAVTAKTGDEKLDTLNKRNTATITIKKKIENAAAAEAYKTREFTFESNQWNENKKITSQTPETITVPVGTAVTVTEQADDLFTTTNSTGGTYTAEITPYGNTTVTFTNTRKPVTVKVIKELDNKGVDDAIWNGFGFPMNYTVDGTAKPAIPVAPGETGGTLTVPFGSTVTLTEAATKDNVNIAEQFDVEYYEGDTKVPSVEFTADDDTPVIKVKNIRKTFTVTVTKTVTIEVEGVKFDPARDAFTFTPTLKNATYTATVAAFNLSNGGSKEYTEVPYGAKFSVKETENTLYDTSATVTVGEYTGVSYTNDTVLTITDDTTIAYTNVRKVAEVTIEKDFESKVSADSPRTFKFDYTYTDGSVSTEPATTTVTVTLTNGAGTGTSAAIKAPVGATFSATEHEYGELTVVGDKTKSVTVAENGNTIVFTNKREVVDVTIDKTVVSDVTADLNGSYFFNVYYEYIVDGVNKIYNENVEVSVMNGHGEVVVDSVPKNATEFKITELTDRGLIKTTKDYITTTGNGVTGATGSFNGTDRSYAISSITDNVTAKFVNTRDTVQVTVTKKVENAAAAALEENFGFTVSGTGYQFTINGNKTSSATFNLQHNGSQTITVPKGVDFVIEETANENYTTEITGATSTNGLTATVKTDATTGSYKVTYTNTRKPIKVNVTKELDNLGMSDSWNTFAFPISYSIDGGEWTAIAGGVKVGDTTKTVEVPYGSKIEIKELVDKKNGELAIEDYFNNDGPKSIDRVTTEGQTLTIKNTRQTVPVKVTKEVVSRIDADNSRDYKFTITTNSADQTYASQTVTIKGAGSATKDVPKGANVTVTETNADTTVFNVEYKNGETYQSGSSKTVDDVTASTEFVIRNTRKEYDLTISKTVNNFDASGDNVYPVTYKITYGDQNVASATLNFKATDDEQGIRNPTTIKVPYGCKVVVSENTAAKVTINGAQYSISDAFDTKINNVETDSHTISSMTDDQTVSVVNTRKTVTVTVHKVVDNKWNIIADKTAEFKIKINGATELETIQVAENNGKISWSKEYTVNYGESFTAVETPDSAFNTKVGYAENSLESGNEKTIEAVTKNSEHDIWFENTRKEIVVTVHKIVKNAAEQNDKFDFTAELKFGEQELTLADTDSAFKLMNYVENGTGDFNEKKITIPYGASIKVAENNYAPRYSSTSHITVEGESKTEYAQNYKELTKNALIEVTNDRQWTYIPVSKVLEAKGATKDANIEFEFTWKYETAEGTVEGSEALKLKGGETKDNVVRVPIGSNVTITETDISLEAYYTGKKVSDIFTTTNNHGSDKVATLTDVQATNDNTVTFTNTHKTVEVFLQKTVVYDYDKNTDFTFIYSGINNGIAANSETTRKHSEGSLLLVEIPVGTGIEVKETSVTGFSTTAVVNNTTYVLGDGNAVKLDAIYEETRINYTNTRELVDVVITKEVVNKGITADNNIEFKFDATAQFDAAHPIVLDDTDKTFNLAHGGSHTIKVPYGATVTVTEDTSMTLEGYNNVPVSTVFDTVKAVNVFENVTENVSATVTNTHREVSVKVTKAVEGLELDKNIEFEFKAEAVRGSDKVTLDNFKLKGADGSRDKSLTIPYGTTLTVTEKTVNTLDVYGGAKVSDVFTTVNGTYTFQPAVDSTQTVTVTNTHKTVQVTVTKIVEGVAGIDDKILYPMTITSVKGSEKATIEGVDTNDGFKLNGIAEGTDKQNSKTFDVYYGTDVKVKELTDTTLTEYGKKISDVFTTTNPEKTLANVKMDQTVEVKNTHNKVKVTVNKVVESEDPADMEKEFNFSATAKIGTTETLGNDDASFSLANGGSKQIDVYYGAAFKVDENLGNEASKYIVTVNGDKQFTAYENAVITFTNKRAAGDLTITKTVTSRTTTDAFVFEITKVTAEGEEPFAPLYVTIHPTKDTDGNGYGSVTIKQLEAGTYTVRELDNWSWAYTAVGGTEKSAKIIGGDQKQVDFTNKDKETNWLRDETANENHFENPKPVTENTTKSVEAVAWDSKFRLAYAAPAGRFDDKETA